MKKAINLILCLLIIYIVLKYFFPHIILFLIFMSILLFLYLFTFILPKKDVNKENLSKTDYAKDVDYFRELIDNYSLEELSYVDDFSINENVIAICILLKMKLANIIEIDQNGIKIINNDFTKLKESEKYILSLIENGKISILTSYELEKLAIKEACENGLIKKVDNPKKRIIKKSIIIMVLGGILNIFTIIFLLKIIKNEFLFLSLYMILSLVFFLAIGLYLRGYKMFLNRSYLRTEKGEEINTKLEGLKLFLKDFSNLNSENYTSLVLWEGYLIFACLFEINNTIFKELSQFVNFKKIEIELS